MRFFLVLLFVLLPSLAQSPLPCRVGFLHLQEAIRGHPDYPRLAELQAKANAEAAPLMERLRPLEERVLSGQASAKERQEWESLRNALAALQARWQERMAPLLRVIEEALNQAVARVARQRGLCLVFSLERATELGLLVYADSQAVITEAVLEELRRPK
ncbi:MAG: OmpH family outer membrane protein [Candidatus Hadarchaeales archaeon]